MKKDKEEQEVLTILNLESKTTVSVDPKEKVMTFPQMEMYGKHDFTEIGILSLAASPEKLEEGKNGEWNADVKIEAAKVPENYPDKIALIQNGAIYSTDDEDFDDFLNGGGLPAGAIAGIVIACVVVVGVVVFCIVWFVVLKKGCCGKGGKNSDAEA